MNSNQVLPLSVITPS